MPQNPIQIIKAPIVWGFRSQLLRTLGTLGCFRSRVAYGVKGTFGLYSGLGFLKKVQGYDFMAFWKVRSRLGF